MKINYNNFFTIIRVPLLIIEFFGLIVKKTGYFQDFFLKIIIIIGSKKMDWFVNFVMHV